MAHSRISQTLRDAAAVSRIAAILSQEPFDSRRALGRRICAVFSFVDATGRLQFAGCMKELATLADTEPCIILPPARSAAVKNWPRQLDAVVPEPVGVPPHLAGIGDLEVVTTSPDRALWDTLIAREHPHGMTTFAGCQLHRVERCRAPGSSSPRGLPEPFPDPSFCTLPAPGKPCVGSDPSPYAAGLPRTLGLPSVSGGEFRR